jgi:hypothetical protein
MSLLINREVVAVDKLGVALSDLAEKTVDAYYTLQDVVQCLNDVGRESGVEFSPEIANIGGAIQLVKTLNQRAKDMEVTMGAPMQQNQWQGQQQGIQQPNGMVGGNPAQGGGMRGKPSIAEDIHNEIAQEGGV